MELFLLYLWLKLDAIGVTLILITVVGVLFYGSRWFYRIVENYGAYDGDKLRRYKITQQRVLIGTLCCWVVGLALPSSQDVAILVAGSYALDLAKSPEGAKVATLLRGKANELLDAEIKKLNPGK